MKCLSKAIRDRFTGQPSQVYILNAVEHAFKSRPTPIGSRTAWGPQSTVIARISLSEPDLSSPCRTSPPKKWLPMRR
ncbi:hypothetical protein PGTUg99_030434 [Puccinia graminis f. sp. tritici]|uniref:Uncharacterized protein n=1 Tax=Puccinia graminis f. sp. tritici TaxID=56615 RepID=A0A5B0S9V4_PUCGR|nr:hypothetical protein PGTUg99_030434 [Puccinia graminis f. sp. tritici]